MNIKPAIYENLTPQQRVAAAIAALSRGDDNEHDRLTSTCPKKLYSFSDYEFSGTMMRLISIAVSNENSLTGYALSMIACCTVGTEEIEERAEGFLQNIADLQAAWTETIQELGVDPDAMNKLVKPIRHPIVDYLVKADLPNADQEQVKILRVAFKNIFEKIDHAGRA